MCRRLPVTSHQQRQQNYTANVPRQRPNQYLYVLMQLRRTHNKAPAIGPTPIQVLLASPLRLLRKQALPPSPPGPSSHCDWRTVLRTHTSVLRSTNNRRGLSLRLRPSTTTFALSWSTLTIITFTSFKICRQTKPGEHSGSGSTQGPACRAAAVKSQTHDGEAPASTQLSSCRAASTGAITYGHDVRQRVKVNRRTNQIFDNGLRSIVVRL